MLSNWIKQNVKTVIIELSIERKFLVCEKIIVFLQFVSRLKT